MQKQGGKFSILKEVLETKFSKREFETSDPLEISADELLALVKKSDDRIYNGRFNELIKWEDLKRKRRL